jgi:hypothetical protein
MTRDTKARVRRLTDDELREWRHGIASNMAVLEQRWQKSKHKDFNALLGALFFCQARLPPWLFTALRELVTSRLPAVPPDWIRWNLVLALRDETGLTWQDTWERASEMLQGTPAKGGPEAIRKSYQTIEKSLPPEWRRKRTYRRTQRPG